MQTPTLIGVAGTNGSGKDTVMQLLAREYNYLFMSATDMLSDELNRRGEPLDREHKGALSAEWRRQGGMGVIVQKAYEAFQNAPSQYAGVIVGSLRHPGEADAIHELGGTMVWVDADPLTRYARVTSASRGRGIEDEVTLDDFMAQEEREMHPIGDAATLNMSATKDKCDITLLNEDSDIPAFEERVREAFGLNA